MPFQNEWYVEKQVIYTRVSGRLTGDDLRASIEFVQHMYEQSDRSLVHQIVDGRDVTQTPSGRELASGLPKRSHLKAGWSIIIGINNPVWRFLADVLMQILRIRFRFFKTMEDGLAFLKETDDSIDWDKADESVLNASAERETIR